MIAVSHYQVGCGQASENHDELTVTNSSFADTNQIVVASASDTAAAADARAEQLGVGTCGRGI